MPRTKHLPKLVESLPSLDGKVMVITGTTTGTGRVAAQVLASKGATVVMLNRKSERADKALAELKEQVPDATFDSIECDLMDLASVTSAAEAVKAKYPEIDGLCCNAGVMALEDKATKDGYDVQMQVNHLSHFLLTRELMPNLEAAAEKTGDARVVMHSSIARYGRPLAAKYFGKNGGKLGGNGGFISKFTGFILVGPRFDRYHQTKLANAVFVNALRDRLKAKGSKVKAVNAHPGLSATNLGITSANSGGLPKSLLGCVTSTFAQTQEDGAQGIIIAMAGKDVKNGDFYGPGAGRVALKGKAVKIRPRRIEEATKWQALLWTASEAAVGAFPLGAGPADAATPASKKADSELAVATPQS